MKLATRLWLEAWSQLDGGRLHDGRGATRVKLRVDFDGTRVHGVVVSSA